MATIDGTSENEDLFGTGQPDTIYGGDGDDVITGDEVDDVDIDPDSPLVGLDADSLFGGAGDDTIIGGLGDTLDGGAGFDELSLDFRRAQSAIVGNLSGAFTAQGVVIAGTSIRNFEEANEIALTNFDDNLTIAGVFVDEVYGLGGNDVLTGGADSQDFRGGDGNDTLTGNADDDRMYGDEGNDILYGDYNSSNTSLPGGADVLYGGIGIDLLVGGLGNDVLYGGDGDDTLMSGIAFGAVLYGGTSYGFSYYNVIDGGNDAIDGGAGIDVAYLQYNRPAAITLNLADPNTVTTIYAGGVTAGSLTGVERLAFSGGSGNDAITGYDYYDYMLGQAGDDVLNGAGGDDTLDGGTGNDRIDGGSGRDTAQYYYVSSSAGVSVSLALQGAAQDTRGAGIDTLANIENLFVSAFGTTASDMLTGNDDNNSLTSFGGGRDALYGMGGDDYLQINVAYDATSATTPAAAGLMDGGDGSDTIYFFGLTRYIDAITVLGGQGNDVINISGAGAVTVSAGSDSDQVTVDTLGGLYGIALGSGRDTLTLAGTSGAFRAANEMAISDFAAGAGGDVLALGTWLAGGALTNLTAGVSPFADGHLRFLQSGTDTLLQADRNGGGDAYLTLLTLSNVQASAIVQANVSGALIPVVRGPITGTEGADTLRGTTGSDTINALGGDDFVYLSQGADTLDGGGGFDRLALRPGEGDLFATSPSGPVTYTFTATRATSSTGSLNTTFSGFEYLDVTDFSGRGVNVDASEFAGRARILVRGGTNSLVGTAFNDNFNANILSGTTTIDAGAGNDLVQLGILERLGTADLLMSDGVLSVVQGGLTMATVTNGERFIVYGATDSAPLSVDASALNIGVSFQGGYSSETIVAGAGDDEFVLANEGEVDLLTGGAGSDAYVIVDFYDMGSGTRITDFAGDDVIDLTSVELNSDYVPTFIGDRAFSGVVGEYRYRFGDGQTIVEADRNGDGTADVSLTITNGAFRLVETSAGSNLLQIAAPAGPTGGNDALTGDGGANTIDGLAGDDVIRGLGGDDVLLGNAGRDLLVGGAGSDVLTGGAGADVFLFDGANLGSDRVTDFGLNDVLVTTVALNDSNRDGRITFGGDKILDLALGGGVTMFTDAGKRLTALEYDGSFDDGGVTYYVYSRVGSAAGVGDAIALI